ncbi:MAG TPA: 4-(cytidine 5'-diphospho)-2-C-methyl-D-erythritol kinase [Chloroflexia bacterium]|nr:4-(cytidine 5'-diphospho)-2-C-methyl-D-erythritol kinase [Chloroflexia bacterium]
MENFSPQGENYYAFAKINLSLEILRKRPDGFHELVSVMQTIGLYDTIRIAPAEDLEFDCNIPELVEETNLVWRAALALLDLCDPELKRGAKIYLEKNIPVAAGLGGGSSDAAATLLALNNIWSLNLPTWRLQEIAATLGSDIPFFIEGGTALVEGRGEILTPLPAFPTAWVTLLYPDLEMPANKTAELYRALGRNDFGTGGVTRALVNAIQRGERPAQSLFHNTFEQIVYERFPQMDHFRQEMVDAGADHVRVSGSGPTLFNLTYDRDEAETLAERLKAQGLQAFAVQTVQ